MENDQLKKDLKKMADGQALHQVPDTKKVAGEALKRIEELEGKPRVKKDQFISNR